MLPIKNAFQKKSLTQVTESPLIHSIDICYEVGKRSIDYGDVILYLNMPMYTWNIVMVEI